MHKDSALEHELENEKQPPETETQETETSAEDLPPEEEEAPAVESEGEAVEGETDTETAADTDDVDIEAQIEAWQNEYKPTEPTTPEAILQQEEDKLNQDIQTLQAFEKNPTFNLPDLVFDGKNVYGLGEDERDDYLSSLQASGKNIQLANAIEALKAYDARIAAYSQMVPDVQQRANAIAEYKEKLEWGKAGEEFLEKLPGLRQFSDKVVEEIDKRLASGKLVAKTLKDKKSIINQVLGELGVYDQLRSQKNGENKPSPSAPDANVKIKKSVATPSKKVWTSEELMSLSEADFLKYEKEIDQAKLEGRVA